MPHSLEHEGLGFADSALKSAVAKAAVCLSSSTLPVRSGYQEGKKKAWLSGYPTTGGVLRVSERESRRIHAFFCRGRLVLHCRPSLPF